MNTEFVWDEKPHVIKPPYGTKVGVDMECMDCKKTVPRTAYNQKRCYECARAAAKRNSKMNSKKRRAGERSKSKIILSKPDSRVLGKRQVVGHKISCIFCGRRPDADDKRGRTRDTWGVYWWRCPCRPAEIQLWDRAIIE